MTPAVLESCRTWFHGYARSFAQENGALHPMLELKRAHSLRVADNACGIARDLGWSDEDVRTAEAIGLLHDVARFPQYTRYGTFSDRRSIDHGEHGAEILAAHGVLEGFATPAQARILDAIRLHNRRDVPEGLDGEHLRFLLAIRDADKLDIFFIINDAVLHNRCEQFPDLLLNVRPDGPATPALVEEIRSRRQGSYEHIHSLADIYLVRTAWIYSMSYTPTLRRIVERNLLLDLRECVPRDPALLELIRDAEAHIARRLAQ